MILAPVPIHGASIMLGPTMTSRRWRRGNYSMIYGIMLPIFIGFTALSVDTSWQRISQSQAQDVADAAAYAALVQLRQTGDHQQGEDNGIRLISAVVSPERQTHDRRQTKEGRGSITQILC